MIGRLARIAPAGMELEPGTAGQSRLRCPICTWSITVVDHGDTLELDTTEGRIRAHLESHTHTDWLAAVASLTRHLADARAVVALQDSWLAVADVCTGCGGLGSVCRLMWPHQRKCCPDCHHRAEPPER